jgi:hypothetical protein
MNQTQKRIILHDSRPAIQQAPDIVQAIDTVLNQAHGLFQREYQRQLEMYRAYNGRYPCYHYEFASVAEHAKAALPEAVRIYLR